MNLEQAMTEHAARSRQRRRKVIAPQFELPFAQEPFRLVGERMKEPAAAPVTPERAADLFSDLRAVLTKNEKPAPSVRLASL